MSRPSTRTLATASVAASALALALIGVRVTPTVRAAAAMASMASSPAPMASTGMVMPSAAAGILVEGAWARATFDTSLPGAAYLSMANQTTTDDALVSVTSPAAATVELHQTTAGDSGMMGMQLVDRIPVPAGVTVTIQPGTYHLMLIGLVSPLTEGSTIDLTLTFEHAPQVTVSAHVVSPMGEPMPSMAMPSMAAPASMAPMPSM